MEQSQLIELIKTLQPAEKEQVLQFAALPFFKRGRMHEQVAPLLRFCFQHAWDSRQANPDKRQVFDLLFPGQSFVGNKVEKVMVAAHRLIRSFLLTQHYFRPDNEFQQLFDFSEIIRLRGLSARYQQTLVALQKMQSEAPWENAEHFQRQFLLDYAIHVEDCLHNRVKGDLHGPECMDALERYYQHYRLGLLSNYMLQQKVASLDWPEPVRLLMDAAPVAERYLNTSPILRVSNEITALLNKPHATAEEVRNLIALLQSEESRLDPASLRKFYSYARNLCVLTSNVYFDDYSILHTLFDLYKDNLQRGYLHYEGMLHSSMYLSVTASALLMKQYDWALAFIETHKDEIIEENEQRDFYRLNLAKYLFATGRFEECLAHIPDNSAFVNYLLHGKRLQIKALYELDSDQLTYKLDAFKMFLIRTSLKLMSEEMKELNMLFANFLNQIIHSVPGDRQRSELLVKRIKEKRRANEYGWLLEKARGVGER